ncbi:MAG: hypothetical protein DRO13_02695 [Thermoprotei archaeon]|nr:MAG: hypothetical protein DRO13_02695 [Thermoprotei archaeon]
MSEPVVFENVTKIFWGSKRVVRALDNASFKIPSKTVAGLLGPNGSGKTTSFKLVMGFLKPSSGKVSVFGVDPWVRGESVRRRIGYLPEKPVYPDVPVYRYLRYVAKVRNASEEDVSRIVRLVGLSGYVWMNTRGLSRGYLQRLGLAQALIGDPELLLLDEPTANLDPLSRREILELIKDLKKELGITIVIATHILPELQEVVDYLLYINRGRVVESGMLEELATRYYVDAYYYIEVEEPRKLASRLVVEDYVRGVEIRDKSLVVRINAAFKEELLRVLSLPEYSIGIRRVEMLTSELGELYEKLSGSSR